MTRFARIPGTAGLNDSPALTGQSVHVRTAPGPQWCAGPMPGEGELWGEDTDPRLQVCRRTPGSSGINDDTEPVPSPAEATNAQAAHELKTLRTLYRVTSHRDARGYRIEIKGRKASVDDVDSYLLDRNELFGADYSSFRMEAQTELDTVKGLRDQIEPDKKVRRKHGAVGDEAQTTFYCWVRAAMLRQLAQGGQSDVSVPQIINGGMTPRLKELIAKVRASYSGSFKSGGYNPRPMKGDGGYRLGTISDHALGLAADINHTRNAHIQRSGRWNALQRIAGESVSSSGRVSLWKSDPRALFDHIVRVNKAFVTALVEKKKALADSGSKDGLFNALVAADTDWKSVEEDFVKEWSGGFFSLDWELVEAFHENGFRWGAVFDTVDLHHFEL